MAEVEIPSYFLCPISLQIMRDPVTLPSGITYDRDSIERWIFSGKHNTCPVTKQSLPECDLTPNHTLRRLIQAWCALNPSDGIERFPTPKPPVNKAQITELIDDAKLPHLQLSSLRKLKEIVSESERNKRCVEATPGVLDFLASIIRKKSSTPGEEGIAISDGVESTTACDEALNILCLLQISKQRLLDFAIQNEDIIESLTSILQQSNYQSRAYATLFLKSMLGVIAPAKLAGVREQLFQEIVDVVRDRISHRADKAALQVLSGLCRWGRNRVKAVNAGAVPVLIELLLDENEKRVCELVLVVLALVCGCAEGRSELVGHAAGIAIVSKKILRISEMATEGAVRILNSVAKFSATTAVLQEMLQIGVVSKLCLVLQVDCGMKTKEKAREILRLHSRVWEKSPCLSPQFLISYPSS
ncbi:E3 ubiquitin-protein ligase PUB23 [Cocos nucifera]|uniref:U-box domain-containing protein n=1 Tax=Cocos nucifera TaxID=13894 RepID=A0A8K0MVS0_COCNU|nr:E3 ubiquitin-protein ligase PUB23 [Cocos nucifera]KAG1327943.1 E3 ubiquitin-protein ligase PUB23 [Cocos nucifera]